MIRLLYVFNEAKKIRFFHIIEDILVNGVSGAPQPVEVANFVKVASVTRFLDHRIHTAA